MEEKPIPAEQVKIELKYLYGELGKEYWSHYNKLEPKFNREVGIGNVISGKGFLEREHRATLLALSDGKPVGFIRLDLLSQPPRIGWLYVDEEFRKKAAVLENTPWLKSEEGYLVKQHLVKAAWVIGRRLGYKEIGSVIHGEVGQKSREWRLEQMPKWEAEVRENLQEPRELLNLLKGREKVRI